MNSTEKEAKIVIFDFDETLVRSKGMFDNVNRRALDILKLPYTEEIVKNLFMQVREKNLGWGKSLEEQQRFFETEFNDLIVKLCNKDEFLKQVKFYDGMRQVIRELAKTNIKLAVASSRDVYSIMSILKREEMLSYFDIIEATEGGKIFKDKPDPEIVKYIAENVGASLENSIMIGDTFGDVQMGKNAGMKTIGIGYGRYTSAKKMKEYNPDDIVKYTYDIKNIPGMVKSLIRGR